MSYSKTASKITFSYLIADLFAEVEKETAAIAKNRSGDNGPLTDRILLTEDEKPFFDKYIIDIKDLIFQKIVNLTFGISAPVTQDATKIEFIVVDKAGYQEASVIAVDRAIFKSFVNGILAQWLLKIELPDLAKIYLLQESQALIDVTNHSIELRKPSI